MKLIGVLLILVSTYLLTAKLEVYKVQTEGEIVQMRITKLPNDCTVRNSSMKLRYQDRTFIKKVHEGICEQYRVGTAIPMKYIENIDTVLYSTESVVGDFVAIGIFIFVGVVALVIGFKVKGV